MAKKNGAATAWVLGDQLTPEAGCLEGIQPGKGVVLMAESIEHCRRLPFHKQKLVLVWSAMRHFADELRSKGYEVDYYEAEPSFEAALAKHKKRISPGCVRLMDTAESGLGERLAGAARKQGLTVDLTPNTLFLSGKEAFQKEAKGKSSRVMEAFYRNMRRQTGLLMDGDKPLGGKWNYDKENRQPPDADLTFPPVPSCPPDKTTADVRKQVEKHFPDHFGSADGFAWPVTRRDAERFLADFIEHRLARFGPFQDAMVSGQRTLFHSLLSPLLNLGLLEPLAVCRAAEKGYQEGGAPLNSVEGFIRQVIGWREFVYQVYHWRMPDYAAMNHLGADLPLPGFYWTAETEMRCVREAVEALLEDGINHHIQRLMVTGNFALLAGVEPRQVNEWYWLAYVDAHEWVVTPNVLGMALYADGGILGTKPYAASANYINRMSDYCKGCAYDPKKTTGEGACPFNALYWDFLARNDSALRGNPRMGFAYRNLDKRGDLKQIRAHAKELRRRLRGGDPV